MREQKCNERAELSIVWEHKIFLSASTPGSPVAEPSRALAVPCSTLELFSNFPSFVTSSSKLGLLAVLRGAHLRGRLEAAQCAISLDV